MANEKEKFRTRIWNEISEPDNPFSAARCYCHGYDVYGELIAEATHIEYIFLLFRGERPSKQQAKALEVLSVALANPGIRDHGVQAAMNGGAGGSTAASCLIAALAVGAGQLGGAREVYSLMEYWQHYGQDLNAWKQILTDPPSQVRAEVWFPLEHPPGFDPNGAQRSAPVTQLLDHLSTFDICANLRWLNQHRDALEQTVRLPLAQSSAIAACLTDLGFTPSQGEMLHLFLRLPGAAAHALEQQEYGWRSFPFYTDAIHLTDSSIDAAKGN